MTLINLQGEQYGRDFSDLDRLSAKTKVAGENHVSWRNELPGYLFILGFALLLLLGRGNIAPPAECTAYPRELVFGVDKGVTLTTKSGVLCPLPLQTPAAFIDDLQLVSPPERGTVLTDGPHGTVYRASPGFHGEDSFTVAMRGHSSIYTGTSVVRVSVAVR